MWVLLQYVVVKKELSGKVKLSLALGFFQVRLDGDHLADPELTAWITKPSGLYKHFGMPQKSLIVPFGREMFGFPSSTCYLCDSALENWKRIDGWVKAVFRGWKILL